ncbi:MAG: SulP family inorganic anion transporter [Myxococcales bacterium]|nr:SulP family inorganic anion transporter [Myxococcales bacterium]
MTDKQNKRSWVGDAVSGFMVSLIALPLCLGIAMASGFPPIAGVLTAIIGGLVVSHLGSAELTIKGPAAGLIVIALGAVTELGHGNMTLGYRRALAVGVVAAVIQILFALFRAGKFAWMMPPFVVHGMLAAIGVIIIAKQAPVVMGVQGAKGEPLHMLMEIPHYLMRANPEILLLGAVSLLVLLFFPLLPWKAAKKIPAPLMVLLVAVPLGLFFDMSHQHKYMFSGSSFVIGPRYLVQLPGALLSAITFPDFSVITSGASIKYIAMFALVGSIESLLSVIAVDTMDPEKRASNLNRDLLATGIGNLACASLGGLPMISEIVRSRANIDAGAKSRWSNFFHGGYLLIFIAVLAGFVQMIPLAALGAMLLVVGTRLASLKEFKHAWDAGWDQFLLFATTLVVTLMSDLLIGVASGVLLKIVLHALRGAGTLRMFSLNAKHEANGKQLTIYAEGALTFLNLLKLRGIIEKNMTDDVEEVVVDFTQASLVDYTTQEKLLMMANEWPKASLRLVGIESLSGLSPHPHAFRRRAN